jgi:hypothetical protein
MNDFLGGFWIVFVVMWWLAGVVFAHGAISTTIACLFPPYAWYLVMEFLIHLVTQ